MRRLLVPTLLTLVMLPILIGLGAWQLERRAWKHAILAGIDAAESRPAIPLPQDPPQFAKVRVSGTLRNDVPALYGAEGRDLPSGPAVGGQLITPLERPDGPPVLVLRGWVPAIPPASAPAPATIEGYVRLPEHPGWFTPDPELAAHRFYTLDPAAIGTALGLGRVAPFMLVALGPKGDTFPDPAHALPRPPDNHLEYALTWFGFALILVVIFTLYARKVLRP
jgi:surfeit locus 1 family protein